MGGSKAKRGHERGWSACVRGFLDGGQGRPP